MRLLSTIADNRLQLPVLSYHCDYQYTVVVIKLLLLLTRHRCYKSSLLARVYQFSYQATIVVARALLLLPSSHRYLLFSRRHRCYGTSSAANRQLLLPTGRYCNKHPAIAVIHLPSYQRLLFVTSQISKLTNKVNASTFHHC